MMPILSVIVLGFRQFETVTKNCLDSLIPWFNHPDIEVLVIDNGSPDDSASLTQQWCSNHPNVRCFISEENRGFAGGMNWGVKHAKGEWLLLVNNDTVFPGRALDALLNVVLSVPSDVAMLGPVTNAAGNGQRLWRPEASHAEWLQIGETLHTHPTQQLMPTYRCDFFCIAIRRKVWEQLGGLDVEFGLGYYEDVDFSLRLRTAGYQQMITEDVFILHVGSATFKGSKDARALIKRNKKLLQTKHRLVRFEHTRLGNLAALERYETLRQLGVWTSSLQLRKDLRMRALEEDAPRSIVKRWLWQRKIKRVFR
ncbi:glycosyltransferase family 2 protein [Rhodoferax aquaticus]|uniref:Glycosyltransferase family 2 protein n=1 Tax=Rhodoferax aquaticus TaxID=2527691 RepID=A0A515ENP7_9BURK|nr:glycosyltransferase family 2 protein [Rhodoferax aquaticus]QDL54293.1 glycosyltransferase family 2 protein [Rhodoferax aquaticus]